MAGNSTFHAFVSELEYPMYVVTAAAAGDRDGCLVGFATLYWFHSSVDASDVVLMNDLFVREDVRGGGIGRALIRASMDETRRRGGQRLEWYTAPDNLPGQRLYDSTGATRSEWVSYELEP